VLLVVFALRGAYPELRRPRLDPGGRLLDVAVGLALAALWMAPFLVFDGLRPDGPGFDPDQLGADRRDLALGLRLLGYAVVTPLFEEIFIRSFVMRYSEVYRQRGDFRTVPLAHYSLGSFVTTVIVFTLGHVPWEWWVAVPWVALTNLWFYYRKDLWALILTHATTNAALLVCAVLLSDRFRDGSGNPISLWFFV
jgi:CAAX prenyl protease-like protein